MSILDHYVDFKQYPNFNLYANEMSFSAENELVSFNKPHIHGYSKYEVYKPWIAKINCNKVFERGSIPRKNILLLGDLLNVSNSILIIS